MATKGLRRLQRADARLAVVVTGADNDTAARLYEGVGFVVDRRDHYYVRRSD